MISPNAYFLASALRLERFSSWVALLIFAAFGVPMLLLGMRSLSGMGPVRRWVAVGVRLGVLAILILILGDAKWVRENHNVEVMIVRDIGRSTQLVSDYPGASTGTSLQTALNEYCHDAALHSPNQKPGDKVGHISFNENPHVDLIPTDQALKFNSLALLGPGTGTNAAAAIQLGLAAMDTDAMHRLLLIWNGNATEGDLSTALAAASSQHVPIDVMPLHYHVDREVMVDKFLAPPRRQEGQPFSIEVHLTSTNPHDVEGDLSITNNNQLMIISGDQTTRHVTIHPGLNVERVEISPQTAGVHEFHATVTGIRNVQAAIPGEPNIPPATQLDNKSADTFTFVTGKGQVLLVDNMDPTGKVDAAQNLLHALADQKIDTVRITPQEFPSNPIALQGYDAIILADVPRGEGGLNDDQDAMLASYVHDTGGGLVMIGGPEGFGAGGWLGSKLEAELPVTMEIPAQRQIPKGALVLLMDPAEAPDGNYWGQQCALKAMETLSPLDEVGVISYSYSGTTGCNWDAPLAVKGDGAAVRHAIASWTLGDLPSFNDAVNLALDGDNNSPGLIKSDARAKHIIIITDDDPEMPTDQTVQRCIDNHISISTITVFPHSPGNVAQGTREVASKTHGKSYGPIESNLNQLPQIFIKEAVVVRRSIIKEDPNGIPISLKSTTSDVVSGLDADQIRALPLYGMDLTGRKPSPLVQVPITAGSKEDPVLAQWQAGLGHTAVYTGDACGRWDRNWVASPVYEKFWSQLVRSVSRSPISSDFETEMTTDGNQGHITVRAVKQEDAFNDFLDLHGTIGGGTDMNKRHDIRLMQTGPGVYEADFDASQEGSYICYLQYKGENGQSGSLVSGTSVNTSPEMRNLQSNDALLAQIAEKTGGRLISPFDASIDLYTREGLFASQSPQSIWDLLIPWLLGLIIVDVAIRRIAWDWTSTKRLATAMAGAVRQFTTTYRKVEGTRVLDSLKRVRAEVAEQKRKGAETGTAAAGAAATGVAAADAAPDRRAKFDAGAGVEGDISNLVGGASDKPVPAASTKKIAPKGAVGLGEHTGGLLEAKRRAREKIRKQEEGE